MDLFIKKLYPDAIIPKAATSESAGMDLCAYIDSDVTIKPGDICMIPCGIAIAIPEKFFGLVAPRSGLAVKYGITILNAPGIVDSDYRGEWKCILINLGKEDFVVKKGMRIAQMIVTPFIPTNFCVVEKLSETERGSGGFGHTGLQ